MDAEMIRDYAQDMGRALATAEAYISMLTDSIKRIREYANEMQKTHLHMYGTDSSTALEILRIIGTN